MLNHIGQEHVHSEMIKVYKHKLNVISKFVCFESMSLMSHGLFLIFPNYQSIITIVVSIVVVSVLGHVDVASIDVGCAEAWICEQASTTTRFHIECVKMHKLAS